jgi:hypothetical protein
VEQALDLLVARRFPVEHIVVCGEDVRLVEDITGPLSYGVAAGRGILGGLLFGVLFGLVYGFLGLTDPIASGFVIAGWGGLAGACAGLTVACVGRWLAEGQRDFLSHTRVEAGRHVLWCDPEHAADAAALLAPLREALERADASTRGVRPT